jgi:ATP-dependent Clp protease ATP-binding subunit ClpA
MFERFSDEARRIVVQAAQEARRRHHGAIRPGHLLVAAAEHDAGSALLSAAGLEPGDVAARVRAAPDPDALDAGALAAVGIDLDAIRARAEARFGAGALDRGRRRRGCRRGHGTGGGALPFAPESKKALELALREAVALGDRRIGPEHVLLGLSRVERLPVALDRAALVAALRARRRAA